MKFLHFDRDISWLSFNERVLMEAGKSALPLAERFLFLSIYSSNSDEFFRVRIPTLMGLDKIDKKNNQKNLVEKIRGIVDKQQQLFGKFLQESLPLLQQHNISLIYNQEIPDEVKPAAKEYFFNQIMSFLQPICLSEACHFFPENNKIYHMVAIEKNGRREVMVVNIPSDSLSRFFSIHLAEKQYVTFIDDIVKENMQYIFPETTIYSCHSFKITRDAELDLKDEYDMDIAEEIGKQLLKRDMGYATRLLYDSNIPEEDLASLIKSLKLKKANQFAGGRYHNLKDLAKLPLPNTPVFHNKKFPSVHFSIPETIFKRMEESDFMLHPPYQDYETVLRFFNEAAIDKHTSEIYVTLYRIAHDSHVAHALISAAKNGKKVTVFVELKARFDEANNIHWAKEMKKAGVKIIYSIPGLKVHAKVALVKRKRGDRMIYYGLLGTGNFNESTARIYADHILFTTHKEILEELELLFLILNKKKKSIAEKFPAIHFKHLIVPQFNMLERFTELIDFEIQSAKEGKPSGITVKLNNLEEKSLINKLYEASNAGVKINLIIRGICRLVPGVRGLSEHITVCRIVDRYLEHGRIFVFHHNGEDLVFSGSADWMTRNIFRRIEVCFPVYDMKIKEQLKKIINFCLQDNTQAVLIDDHLQNIPVIQTNPLIQAQKEIYKYISSTTI